MASDNETLDLLAVFHYVLSGILGLFGLFPLIYVGIGIAMINGQFDTPHEPPPPEFVGWVLIGMGIVMILCAWTLALLVLATGLKLRKRRSYTFCMVIAAIECLFMPFGTALGIFTLITLTKPGAKALFSGIPMATPQPRA